LLLLMLAHLPGSGQDVLPSKQAPFVFRTWKLEDGLPHNSVTAIAQSPDGYLWLGTYNGLARFDGVHCHVLGLKDGLRSLQISALLQDSHGTLWIGTVGGGLSRLEHGEIKTLTSAEGLAGDTVNDNMLVEDQAGSIWIGTTSGLNHWKNGALTNDIPANVKNEYISALALDHDGSLWIGTSGRKLISLRAGNIETNAVPPEVPLIEALMVDRQNNLWMAAPDGRVFCRNNSDHNWIAFGPTNGLPNAILNKLAQTQDGTIWVGSFDQGIYFLKDGRFTGLRETDGLSSDAIYALFSDRDQFFWVGTRAGGLCRLTPRHLYNLKVLENGVECFPHSLAETPDGTLWVGTAGRGLFQWDGIFFDQFLSTPPLNGHMFVRTVLAGHDGSLWWGAGPALYQWKDNQLVHYFNGNNEPWLVGDRVFALCDTPEGGLWVGTFNGQLKYWQNTNFVSVGHFGSQPITDIVRQRNGAVWIGTLGGGLVRLQDGIQTTFTMKDGLNSTLIQTLFLDHNDDLWIGTVGGGLSRWRAGKFSSYGLQQGLADDSVSQIVEDDTDNLWLGCNRGIMRVNEADLDRVASHADTVLHPQILSWREGMLSEQCVVGFNAAIKTRKDKLLFSTSKGIVVVDPNEHIAKASPPRVLLEKVVVDGNDETSKFSNATSLPDSQVTAQDNPAAVPELGPGPKVVKFQFTGLSFDAPELIQFRYQLEGADSGWVDADNDRVASYAHLPPGHYNFHVIACNAQGVWNQTGAAVQFYVLPFFWQRGWFVALAYLVVVGFSAAAVLVIVRQRYRRQLKFLEMERATENERARIARDLHDEVGSSLTRISMLSEQIQARLSEPEQLKARTLKLSDFVVRTTRAFEEIVWAVNPRNDSLRSLLEYLTHFANELFDDSGITCRFKIPDNLPDIALPPEIRHGIFLVIKEALNNALKHAAASHVTLQAELDSRSLLITVQDDGKGFEANTSTTENIGHNGLPNMRQRIKNLGGQLEIESRPGAGTTIRIHLAQDKLVLHKTADSR